MSISAMIVGAALALQPVQEAPTQVEDVVVSGRALEEQVRSFLGEVALPEPNLRPARWHNRVCVGVANLRQEPAQLVIDRISQVALDVGLTPGEPGCVPNILIVATNDGSAAASGLFQARRRAFLPGGGDMVRRRSAFDEFRDGEAPIRWWHVVSPIDRSTGKLATRLPGFDPPLTAGLGSRLRTDIRSDLNRVVIILDLTKLEDLNFQQIADYSAMIALSQVDSRSDFSNYDSILALMPSQRDRSGITEWDMAYLNALYDAELNLKRKNHEYGTIASLMERAEIRVRRQESASTPTH